MPCLGFISFISVRTFQCTVCTVPRCSDLWYIYLHLPPKTSLWCIKWRYIGLGHWASGVCFNILATKKTRSWKQERNQSFFGDNLIPSCLWRRNCVHHKLLQFGGHANHIHTKTPWISRGLSPQRNLQHTPNGTHPRSEIPSHLIPFVFWGMWGMF